MKKCDQYYIYFNLHNRLWSIRHDNGLVVGHAKEVMLCDVTPVISETGRKRVVAEKRKNVHAFLKGKVVALSGFQAYKERDRPKSVRDVLAQSFEEKFRPVSYNPYKRNCFYYKDDDRPYHGSRYAFLDQNRQVTVAGVRA